MTFHMSHFQTLAKGGVTYRDEPWHKECFVCTSCKTQLAGQHFTSRDDSPYCLKCFGNLYAKKCEACAKPITGKSTSLGCARRSWTIILIHSDEKCKETWLCVGFLHCVELSFLTFNLLCCSSLPGFGGGKYISFEDRQWHQPCFTCSQCSVSLVGVGFFPDGDRILCRDCHSSL